MRSKSEPATTVFYNSACPVCNAGIRAQRGRMQGCDLRWIDVHQDPMAVQQLGTGLEQVRERLYVRDATGRIHIGADALAQLWAGTDGLRWLGRLVRLPGLRGASTLAYNLFARALYRWNRRRGRW